MTKISNVLFLCTANICRSIAAEYIAKWYKETKYKWPLENVNFDSAGLYNYEEYPFEGTINYLRQKGINLNQRKTKKIDLDLINKQDLILGFEEKWHIKKLLRRFKNIATLPKKTFLLLDFAGEDYDKEIEDPLIFSAEKYIITMEKIEFGVLKAIERIIEINH